MQRGVACCYKNLAGIADYRTLNTTFVDFHATIIVMNTTYSDFSLPIETIHCQIRDKYSTQLTEGPIRSALYSTSAPRACLRPESRD